MSTLPEVLDIRTTIYYGFTERCEVTKFPNHDTTTECRPFPTKDSDACDRTYRSFCTLWSTASYFSYLAIGFGAVTCAAIVFGVSTHSRRKRIWKVVAATIAFHGTFETPPAYLPAPYTPNPLTLDLDVLGVSQLVAFIFVTDLYRLENFPLSVITHSHLGTSRHF